MSSLLICQLNMPYISLHAFYTVKPDLTETPENLNAGVSETEFGKFTLNYLVILNCWERNFLRTV